MPVQAVLDYMEAHLREPLELSALAGAVHYSKYHLLHEFTKKAGQPPFAYLQRRRLTEAARMLAETDSPILEIAFLAGYGSQQAFSARFRKMYKNTPAGFRKAGRFYPLQLPMQLDAEPSAIGEPVLAGMADLPQWTALVRLAADGFPCLEEGAYRRSIAESIRERRAWMIAGTRAALGAAVVSGESGAVEFLAVHPQYRGRGIGKRLLKQLARQSARPLSLTTFRGRDPADTGYRAALLRMGFREDALLTEFGYPTQRLILPEGVRL